MSESGSSSAPSEEVVVQLLDAALGRPVKTWRFATPRQAISIGRLPECDVEISDAYVSRLHAELQCRHGQWFLAARGRSGVVVRNSTITELPVDSEVTFQLGSAGPVLRFAVAHEDASCGRTLCFDSQPMPAFLLDQAKLESDVGAIAEGDYFRKLQEQARTLRAQRSA
jgi:hypothetical protein